MIRPGQANSLVVSTGDLLMVVQHVSVGDGLWCRTLTQGGAIWGSTNSVLWTCCTLLSTAQDLTEAALQVKVRHHWQQL